MKAPYESPRMNVTTIERLVRMMGSRAAVADFLGTRSAVVATWLEGHAAPNGRDARRMAALLLVLERVQLLPEERRHRGWLRLPHAALDGATPEDVLLVDGPDRILAIIDDELGR